MKRFIVATLTALTLLCGVAVLQPVSVSAVDILDPVCQGNSQATACKDDRAGGSNPIFGPDGILTTVMTWLARIVGLAAVIVIMVSGFMMIASRGEANETATARRALLYAIIGLVVAAFAQVMVSFVLSKL